MTKQEIINKWDEFKAKNTWHDGAAKDLADWIMSQWTEEPKALGFDEWADSKGEQSPKYWNIAREVWPIAQAALPPDQSARIAELEADRDRWMKANGENTVSLHHCFAEINQLKSDREALAMSLEEAAKDFVSANGARPEWWNRAMLIVARIKAVK